MDSLLLIVDDDSDDLEFFKDTIKEIHSPPRVEYFTNGKDLLKYLEILPLPIKQLCITIDINMPGMDGLTLLGLLKEHPEYKKIPVFIITTSSSAHHKEQSKKIGAEEFYTKPVQLIHWKQIIDAILSSTDC